MIRKFLAYSLILSLVYTTVACGGPVYETNSSQTQQPSQPTQDSLADGEYPIQQATYNDVDGEYSLALLNTAPGAASMFHTTNLPMARLTDAEISAGKDSYLKVEQNQSSLHLSEDFKIEYIHNVTETQNNPQTGQPEVVVVRQEPSFWTPFAGALAGQALGSLLFTPQYYFPPIYRPGVILTGYGGYGRTYDQAASRYQSRYQAPPVEVQNRRFRSTGRLRSPYSTSVQRSRASRSTGSGYGSTDLRRSNRPSSRVRTAPRRGFGSARPRTSRRR